MTIQQLNVALVIGAAVFLVSCGGPDRAEVGEGGAEEAAVPAATGAAPDTTGAALWAHIQNADYAANWARWPGTEALYAGNDPHGMLLTTYVNEVANAAITTRAGSMPAGAIIVKENYMPDSTLAAVTVMYKRSGYNAEHNDWFFTKHLPTGELDTMPNGMAMEGRLMGCQNCHMAQRANDYVFTGSLTAGQ